jgi:hypothetical protein
MTRLMLSEKLDYEVLPVGTKTITCKREKG